MVSHRGPVRGVPCKLTDGPHMLFMSGATVAMDGPFGALWCVWPVLLVVISRTYHP